MEARRSLEAGVTVGCEPSEQSSVTFELSPKKEKQNTI